MIALSLQRAEKYDQTVKVLRRPVPQSFNSILGSLASVLMPSSGDEIRP